MSNPLLYHGGLCLIASLFLISGINNLTQPKGVLMLMHSKGLPFTKVGLGVVIAIKLIASLMLILNVHVELAALALIAFMVAATALFHNFWAYQGQERLGHYHAFLSNTAIIGALLLLL